MTDETLFATALDKPDPAARAAYLDSVCLDPDQRKRVEALLAAHAAASGFLEQPPAAPDASTQTLAEPPAGPPALAATRVANVQPVSPAPLAYLRPSERPGSLGRIGHYEVQEVLGSGGFGTVLKAFDERLHRVVAVKVLAPQLAASGAARARFVREGRSAAAVRDEHIVGVHAVSDDGESVPYLVMEFVSGQTLQQKLDKSGPLPPKEVLRIGAQIARGLAAAHDTGLIHRDIKPANILLENGVERVKIADFGLARAADDASISQSGVVAGTPVFMSPEQARGEKVDSRSDLFSLGSVLYALCTGHPPFRAETTMGVLKRVIEDDPRPIREVNADVPEWLCRIVAKLHAKRPDDRFQTAAEVADLLADCGRQLQAHGTLADAARIPVAKAPPRRRWWPVVLAVGVVVVGVALMETYFAAKSWYDASGPARRYAENRNEVVFNPTKGLVAVVVTQNGETVAGPLDVREPVTIDLPPGKYEVRGVLAPGWEIDYWTRDCEGYRMNTVGGRWEPPEYPLYIERGDRITVRVVLKTTPKPADGWELLFDGRTFEGWQAGPGTHWKIENGELYGAGAAGALVSNAKFRDFRLRAEVLAPARADSGILVRAPAKDPKAGLEINIFGGAGEWNTGSIENEVKSPAGLAPPDQWFTLEVEVRGTKAATWVSGWPAAECDGVEQTDGHVAIQSHGPKAPAVRFRKVEIKNLTAAKK